MNQPTIWQIAMFKGESGVEENGLRAALYGATKIGSGSAEVAAESGSPKST